MPISPDTHTSSEECGTGMAKDDDADKTVAQDEHDRLRPCFSEEIEAAETEEAQPQKSVKIPDMPTKADMAEHRACGHIPYRDWCPDCVEAFGRERAHQGHEGDRSIPLISCDYLFITPRGVLMRDEMQEEDIEGALKVMVAYCGVTKSLFTHAVPKKGLDEDGYIVEQLKQDVLWLGHAKVVIRSDNQPALVQVVQTTLAALKMAGVTSAIEEGSVPYDPQTNGAAENAVRLLKGTLKANLLGLDWQIQARVPVDHPIVTWLVSHSASVRTMRVKGPDERTAQQRASGSAASTKLIPFGEVCRYQARAHRKKESPIQYGVGAPASGLALKEGRDSTPSTTKPWAASDMHAPSYACQNHINGHWT